MNMTNLVMKAAFKLLLYIYYVIISQSGVVMMIRMPPQSHFPSLLLLAGTVQLVFVKAVAMENHDNDNHNDNLYYHDVNAIDLNHPNNNNENENINININNNNDDTATVINTCKSTTQLQPQEQPQEQEQEQDDKLQLKQLYKQDPYLNHVLQAVAAAMSQSSSSTTTTTTVDAASNNNILNHNHNHDGNDDSTTDISMSTSINAKKANSILHSTSSSSSTSSSLNSIHHHSIHKHNNTTTSDYFLASQRVQGGGYAYIHQPIDSLLSSTHSIMFSAWVYLLNDTNTNTNNTKSNNRRIVFTTDIQSQYSSSSNTTFQRDNNESSSTMTLFFSSINNPQEDVNNNFTSHYQIPNIHRHENNHYDEYLTHYDNGTYNNNNHLSLPLNQYFQLSFQYSHHPSSSSSSLSSHSNYLITSGNSVEIPTQQWVHVGFSITPTSHTHTSSLKNNNNSNNNNNDEADLIQETIRLYINGTIVAEQHYDSSVYHKLRSNTTSTTNTTTTTTYLTGLQSSNHQPMFQPLSSNVNRIPKTYFGRNCIRNETMTSSLPSSTTANAYPTSAGNTESLEGFLTQMALFAIPIAPFQNFTLDNDSTYSVVNQIFQILYERGLDYKGESISILLPSSSLSTENLHFKNFSNTSTSTTSFLLEPVHFYPLNNESKFQTRLNNISKLIDIQSNYHGIIRRNVKMSDPFVFKGGNRYREYLDGSYTPPNLHNKTAQEVDAMNEKARSRRLYVRNAMKHAWEGYRMYAWGNDEIKPLSNRGENNWGGMGCTLIDSLSTLWIMDMKDEFWEARDWVRDHFSMDHVGAVSVFETTIRILGGLLSAYDLSGDKTFLEKADDVGSRLSNAFHSSTGIPFTETFMNRNYSYNTWWHESTAVLSEFGTMQLEFRYLSYATGKKEYADLVDKVINLMEDMNPENGLYPIYVHNHDRERPSFGTKKITFGAMGDSFYEYLLKGWLQSGRRESRFRNMYDKAMDGVNKLLVNKSKPNGLSYLADLENLWIYHKMDHLVCFMGGTLALGAYSNPDGIQSPRSQRDLQLGKALAYTCYQMYARHKTGMSPEIVTFDSHRRDFKKPKDAAFYILRPETVESFYILYQLTGDPIYREWGWEIFQAIEEHCRTDAAYASIEDVNDPSAGQSDRMESFFLAETLKYSYLLQDPDNIDFLNKYVFNTEAHPLRMLHVL